MRRLLVVDDRSSSVRTVASDVRIATIALIASPDRAELHSFPHFSTLVCPVTSVGTYLWSSDVFSTRLVYGDVDEVERAVFIGADDFLCEPWTATELLLRLSRLSRSPIENLGNVIEVSGATFVVSSIQATIWRALLERAGNIVDRDLLGRLIMEESGKTEKNDSVGQGGQHKLSRAVDMHIARIRHAIGGNAHLVETVRGRGYRLNLPQAK